ncbi:MAG: winged helix-turn-helix transcriptional regulator [Deltaproteobacteria bacterium]|nr:winged helix-turn-helix transcriptional regulator [Deltaproteobacteria bacterium]
MKGKEIYEIHAEICQCLANPKRLEIINALRGRELSATGLAGKVGISKANASQHLAIMRNKGIVKGRRDGVNIYYSLSSPKVTEACDIMKEVLFEFLRGRQRLVRRPKS